jgi:hypothetical protein
MKILSILFIGLFCTNTAPAFSSHQNTTNPHTKNKHAQTAQGKGSGVFGKMSKFKSAVSGHTANAALLKKCATLKSHGKPLTKECIAAQKQEKKKPTSAANAKKQPAKKNSMFASMNPFGKKKPDSAANAKKSPAKKSSMFDHINPFAKKTPASAANAKKQPAKKNSMFASMNPFAKKQAAEPAVDDSSMDTDAIMTDDEIDSTGDMNMDDGSMNEEEVDPDAIDDGSMNEEEVDPDAIDEEDSQ